MHNTINSPNQACKINVHINYINRKLNFLLSPIISYGGAQNIAKLRYDYNTAYLSILGK